MFILLSHSCIGYNSPLLIFDLSLFSATLELLFLDFLSFINVSKKTKCSKKKPRADFGESRSFMKPDGRCSSLTFPPNCQRTMQIRNKKVPSSSCFYLIWRSILQDGIRIPKGDVKTTRKNQNTWLLQNMHDFFKTLLTYFNSLQKNYSLIIFEIFIHQFIILRFLWRCKNISIFSI